MKNAGQVWSFKTETISPKTGQKNGPAKYYVWAHEVEGIKILTIKRLILERAAGDKSYAKEINGYGLSVEKFALRFDTVFTFARIAAIATELLGSGD